MKADLQPSHDVYDRVAPRYRVFRRWWLAAAGGFADRRLRRAIRGALRPGIRVLDAGAGTGAVSTAVLAEEPAARITMLDRSAGMLAQARALGAFRVQGDIAAMPFRAGSFDLVIAAWVLETLPDPAAAVREMLRVLSTHGRLLTVFSAHPRSRLLTFLWRPLEQIISAGFSGRFLMTADVPFHECHASRRQRPVFAPTETVFLARCCLESLTIKSTLGSGPQTVSLLPTYAPQPVASHAGPINFRKDLS